jgi:hypothetical protein
MIATPEKVATPPAITVEPKRTVAPVVEHNAKPESLHPDPLPKGEGEEAAAPVLRGVEHDPAKRLTVYQLGFALAALALASSYPAVMEVVRHVRDPLSPGIESWAYLLLLISGVQLVYAFYLVQLPDWSSVWVTMIVTAVVAVLYASGMGMSLMARPDNEIIAALGLTQLHDGGYLTPWCFISTLLTALLSYMMVRTSLKWHKLFTLAMSHAQA